MGETRVVVSPTKPSTNQQQQQQLINRDVIYDLLQSTTKRQSYSLDDDVLGQVKMSLTTSQSEDRKVGRRRPEDHSFAVDFVVFVVAVRKYNLYFE